MSETEEKEQTEGQKVEIKYTYARFHRRVFANLVDFLLFAFAFLGLFLGIRGIVMSTPGYRNNSDRLTSMRVDSGLYYKEESGHTTDIISHLSDPIAAFSEYTKQLRAGRAVDQFIAYVRANSSETKADEIQKEFDDYRLGPDFVYEGVPYFVVKEGKIRLNTDCKAPYSLYFKDVYGNYIDTKCQAYLITCFPEYLDLVRFESNMLFYAELLPALLVAPLIAYLLPMMIFRRGRQTIGKKLYKIATVDSRLLVPTVPRTLARFAIFYLAELCLSVVTFAIPFIISASLMAFSKSHQGFPDYLLGLYEVDVTSDKIYFSREEILQSGIDGSKKPVDFQPTYED